MSVFRLPFKPGTCPVCGARHPSVLPHNVQSFSYRYAFYGRFGRWPNWWDATVSVTAEVREKWFQAQRKDFAKEIDESERQPPAGDVAAIAVEILEWEDSIIPGQLIPMTTFEPIMIEIEEMEAIENE